MPIELLLAIGGLVAGAFGALLGLGGGILLVPLLTLGFGLPLPAAVGTSLVCVIATSTGGAAVNVSAGRADVRLGIGLAAGTVLGAFTGAIMAGFLPERLLAGLFAILLAYTTGGDAARPAADANSAAADEAIDPTAPDGPVAPAYRTTRLPWALGGSFLAGNVSGLLGIGGGAVTVPLVHLVMAAPMRVAVATSNYIIGITGAAGAYAYLFRGDIDPRQAAPVVLGVVAGAALGARFGSRHSSDMARAALRGRPRLRRGRDGASRAGRCTDARSDLGRTIAARRCASGRSGPSSAWRPGLHWPSRRARQVPAPRRCWRPSATAGRTR